MLQLLDRKLMLGLSAIFFGLTMFFVYVVVYNLDEPKNLVSTSKIYENVIEECAAKANDMGFETVTPLITSIRKSLTIKETVVKDPMAIAIKSSLLQTYCKKLSLDKYCIGDECKRSLKEPSHQFNMTLKLTAK